MKKWVLFLYSISILLLGIVYSDNVFAKEVFPYYSSLNNTVFTSSFNSYNARVVFSPSTAGGTFTLNVSIQSFNGNSVPNSEYDESFSKYPYTIIFFQTGVELDEIGITKNSSCTYSCFGRDNITLKQVGSDAASQRYKYMLILENKKWQFIEGSLGGAETIYRIDDSFTFTNNLAVPGLTRAFIFYQVLLTDNGDLFNNNAIDVDSLINNAIQNRTQIVNAIGGASTNISDSISSSSTNIIDNIASWSQNLKTTLQTKINETKIILENNQQQTNQKLDDVNNSLNSEEAPTNNDVSNKTSEWSSKLAGTGPVSNMVLMPITLLNGYISGFNSSCSPYNLGAFYGTDIVLPCINISNYLGATLWGVIDVLFSGFMIYAIGKKFVKIFNDFTNLRDNQMDELYGGGK